MVGNAILRVILLPGTQVSETPGGTEGRTIIRSLINVPDWNLAVVGMVVLC